jgi:phytoene desaturase
LERSLHKFSGFVNIDTIKAIFSLSLLEINQNLHSVNANQLVEPHLVQIYDRYATYNGSSPFQTPGIMTLVQHLEQEFGTFIPTGGMEQITLSLFELAKRKGVTFNMKKKVKEIIVEEGKAVGIKAENFESRFDLILSNMDIFPTYKNLLRDQKAPKRILRQESSSSAVIFYWGIKNKFNQLDLHNIFFSKNYKSEFDSIFNQNSVSDDFTVYVNITSKDVPQDAPEGCENWFVMINVPSDQGQDWESIKNRLREKTINKLNKILKVNLETMIEEEAVMTPPLIAQKTASHNGALYGSSSNNKMAAFLRHPNFNSKIKNLYFCGGSVHPGGGIPLCLLSAKIAADMIPNASNVKD